MWVLRGIMGAHRPPYQRPLEDALSSVFYFFIILFYIFYINVAWGSFFKKNKRAREDVLSNYWLTTLRNSNTAVVHTEGRCRTASRSTTLSWEAEEEQTGEQKVGLQSKSATSDP